MGADRDINTIVIPIPPTAYKIVGGLVEVLEKHAAICQKLGYNIIEVCINKDNHALEVHVQTAPDTVTLVETTDDISQSLRQYIEQYIKQMPPIEILPSPIMSITPSKAIRHKTESNLIKNYNRAQNTKYNSVLRNYKGRKR